MTLRRFLSVSALLLFAAGVSFAQTAPPGVRAATGEPNPGGVISAIHAVPHDYVRGILEISGKSQKSAPNPPQWNIVARNAHNPADIRGFIIIHGQLSGEFPIQQSGLAALSALKPIIISRVRIDAIGIWYTAQQFASSRGTHLGPIDYTLEQQNPDPVWVVKCFSRHHHYLGTIHVLATTGAVISKNF